MPAAITTKVRKSPGKSALLDHMPAFQSAQLTTLIDHAPARNVAVHERSPALDLKGLLDSRLILILAEWISQRDVRN